MIRLLFFLLLTIAIQSQSGAQRLFFVFGHAEYAAAAGKLKDSHDKGLGVEAGIGVGTSKTFFTGTLGYTWLQNLENANGNAVGSLRYAPARLGVRRYVFRRNIFLKGDAGVANMKPESGSTTTHFTAGIGAGVKFSGFEILGEYTTVTSWGSWLSLKAGMTFGL